MRTEEEYLNQIRALEKANRVLQRKLERTQTAQLKLEETNEKKEFLLRKIIQDLNQAEQQLQNLIEGTAAKTGWDFFPALVKHVSAALNISYALVTEYVDGKLRSLASWANGSLQPTFSYHPAKTPCERTLRDGMFYCECSVQQQFPDYPDLVRMGAESYMGIALKDSQGRAIGNLCILHQQPFQNPQQAEQLLRVFAARAAAELERQQATAALEKLNQSLETTIAERTKALSMTQVAIDLAAEAVFLVRPDSSFYYANEAACNILGYSRAELLTLSVIEVDPEFSPQRWAEHWQAVKQQRSLTIETQHQRKDGHIYPAEININYVEIEGEAYIFSFARDISDRKQAEDRLRQLSTRLNLAVESAGIGIWDWDISRNNLVWDEQMYKLYGITSEQFNNAYDAWLHGLHPDDREMAEAVSQQALRGERDYNTEFRVIHPDGSIRFIKANALTQRNDQGDPQRMIGVNYDMTELKNTQLQLIQSEKMSSLGQLVAGIAHEINNPVSFIYGNLSPASDYADDLAQLIRLYQAHYPNPPEAIADFIEQVDIEYIFDDFPNLLASMETGAERIRDIVTSLRTFSRLDQADYAETDLHANIDAALVILQNRLNGRAGIPGIEVIKNYGDIPLVECYSGLLNQVFMNLLTNAIDAIEERQTDASSDYSGCIKIKTSIPSDNKVAISIQDNGHGMNPEVQFRVFDPFFTTKPTGVGTGMGLSISYQIVTGDHKGQLYCWSTLGEGTEFVIELCQSNN